VKPHLELAQGKPREKKGREGGGGDELVERQVVKTRYSLRARRSRKGGKRLAGKNGEGSGETPLTVMERKPTAFVEDVDRLDDLWASEKRTEGSAI